MEETSDTFGISRQTNGPLVLN